MRHGQHQAGPGESRDRDADSQAHEYTATPHARRGRWRGRPPVEPWARHAAPPRAVRRQHDARRRGCIAASRSTLLPQHGRPVGVTPMLAGLSTQGQSRRSPLTAGSSTLPADPVTGDAVVMSSTRPRLQAGATLAAAAWGVQHLSSPAVRHWRPSTAPVLRAGRLRVRVLGSGESSVVLLHGIVGCGDYFGASYDRLGSGHRLLVPDLSVSVIPTGSPPRPGTG